MPMINLNATIGNRLKGMAPLTKYHFFHSCVFIFGAFVKVIFLGILREI